MVSRAPAVLAVALLLPAGALAIFDPDNPNCNAPCPTAHDGECDSESGLFSSATCPPGSDWLDCE